MQLETTEDQGLYNMPSAAVHPGALAAGSLPHNITYTLSGKMRRFSVPYELLFNRKCHKALVISQHIFLCAPLGWWGGGGIALYLG